MKNAPRLATDRTLKVGGVVPFTATDYPGQLSAVIFVQGCPWRCGYCHNPHLQSRPDVTPVEWSSTLDLLKRRVGLIDAVVFSGGEPTIDPALSAAMNDVRELGFKVGLHTAGIYPGRLAEVLPNVDWVGLDIKAPFSRYDRITCVEGSGRQALMALEAVLASGCEHEIRTTIHPTLLDESDIIELAETLARMGVKNYVLQKFHAQPSTTTELNDTSLVGYPSQNTLKQLAELFPRFLLRNG